ncbi:MAG: type II secretion system F family protein [Sinobacteraceae bacterium]|nr:type II secretion system F family protein [Nevskiaceae bacterium]
MSPSLSFALPGVFIFGGSILFAFVARAVLLRFVRSVTQSVRGRLEDAFIFVDPTPWVWAGTAAVLLAPVLVWRFVSPGLAVLVLVALLAGPVVGFTISKARRRANLVLQLPDMLLMLGSSLRAGTSLQVGMDLAIRETPAPLSLEMAVVVREQRLGLALEDALETLATRLKLEEVDLVVSAMTIARDVGGNLAEILDQLARTLRAKATMEGKIRALTSQGKLQGLIVGALPIFLMVALSFMQHDAMMPLFDSKLGYLVLGVIGVAEVLGFLWIRKIVTIDI